MSRKKILIPLAKRHTHHRTLALLRRPGGYKTEGGMNSRRTSGQRARLGLREPCERHSERTLAKEQQLNGSFKMLLRESTKIGINGK